MVPMEIERKFTVRYLPKEIENIKRITQKHIFKDMVCSIRVRSCIDLFTNEKVFTHTIKARREDIQKYSICELERNITEEEYNKLKPFDGSKVIEKYRCIVPIGDNLKAEVDIFDGWMKGLIIAEVEFGSVEQAENFKMPDWFETEVFHKDFSNRNLSTKSRDEILEIVGKRQLEVNEIIYGEAQKIMKSRVKR